MPRVASLFLPDFATDRLRRIDRRASWNASPPSTPPDRPFADAFATPSADVIAGEGAVAQGGGWRPGARWAQDTGSADWLERRLAKKRARRAALQTQIDTLPPHQRPPMRELGRRSEAAPIPFRDPRTTDHPFRPMQSDEGSWLAAAEPSDFGGHVRRPAASLVPGVPPVRVPDLLAPPPARTDFPRARHHGFPRGHALPQAVAGPAPQSNGRPPYDLAGAFWQQGAAVGRAVTRAATGQDPAFPPPSARPAGLAPLVTTCREGQRVVLAAVCPAARAIGLAPAMPLTKARAMIPGLDARPRDEAGEGADLARLAAHAARWWTPLAQVAGTGLSLDITGSAHLFGGEEQLCRRILGLCRRLGFAARIAVADTPRAARALAQYGGQALRLCPPGGVADAVASLPLDGLGIEPKLVDALRRLGVERIGQVAAMPRGPLARRFGRGTLDLLDRLMGAKADPIDPLVVADAPEASLRFAEPVLTVEGLGHALAGIATRLAATLASRGLGARALVLECLRIDRDRQVIALGLARASRDAAHITRLLAMRIEEVEPGFGIEAMRLTAVRADALGAEAVPGALAGDPPPPDLAVLIDRLAVRLGRRRLYRLGMVESEVPERGQCRHAPLGSPPAWPDPWPRPVRLLDPPERVENIMAELPDHPPRRFRWRGREHRVVRADGPERIYGEWWRRAAEADAVRDYFQVEDEAGARFWLYRRGDGVDARTGDLSWHMQGLFG